MDPTATRSRLRLPWVAGGIGLLSVLVAAMWLVSLTDPGPGSADAYKTLANESALRKARVLTFPDVQVALVFHEGKFLALSTKSPHLKHPIDFCRRSMWFEDRFHGEKFDILGYHKAGPTPRGMDRHPFVLEGGSVKVDLGVIIEGPPRGTGSDHPPEGRFCVGP